jgi:hypothetical protein
MKTTTVHIADDLGGAGEASTVSFSFKGVDYEIDLNKRNSETFERHMQRWIEGGRAVKAKTNTKRVPSQPRTTSRGDALFEGRVGEVAAFIAANGQMPHNKSADAEERSLANFVNNSRSSFRGTSATLMSDERKAFFDSRVPGWENINSSYQGFTA